MSVEVDTAAAERMADRVIDQASGDQLVSIMQRVARENLSGITGAPGSLASAFEVRREGNAVNIVNTVWYSRFVFRDRRLRDDRIRPGTPPNLPTSQIARQLADQIGAEVPR